MKISEYFTVCVSGSSTMTVGREHRDDEEDINVGEEEEINVDQLDHIKEEDDIGEVMAPSSNKLLSCLGWDIVQKIQDFYYITVQ